MITIDNTSVAVCAICDIAGCYHLRGNPTKTTDLTPEAVERLAYNLSDWGQHDEGLINDYRDYASTTIRALSAALTASQAETAAVIEVKPLIWEQRDQVHPQFKAVSVMGAYYIERNKGGLFDWWSPMMRWKIEVHTLGDAKAAAQADYETLIMDAIALTPADSKTALDRMIADARADGMRKALDAASDYTQRVYGDDWKFLSNPIDRERILAAIPKGG